MPSRWQQCLDLMRAVYLKSLIETAVSMSAGKMAVQQLQSAMLAPWYPSEGGLGLWRHLQRQHLVVLLPPPSRRPSWLSYRRKGPAVQQCPGAWLPSGHGLCGIRPGRCTA